MLLLRPMLHSSVLAWAWIWIWIWIDLDWMVRYDTGIFIYDIMCSSRTTRYSCFDLFLLYFDTLLRPCIVLFLQY